MFLVRFFLFAMISSNAFAANHNPSPSKEIPTLAALCLKALKIEHPEIKNVIPVLTEAHTKAPLVLEQITSKINPYAIKQSREENYLSPRRTKEAQIVLGNRLAFKKKSKQGSDTSLIIHETCKLKNNDHLIHFIDETKIVVYEPSSSCIKIWDTQANNSNLHTIPLINHKNASLNVLFFQHFFAAIFPHEIHTFDHKTFKKESFAICLSENEKILTARKSSQNKLAVFTTKGIRLYLLNPQVFPNVRQSQYVSYVPNKIQLVTGHKINLSKPLLLPSETKKPLENNEQKLIEVKA